MAVPATNDVPNAGAGDNARKLPVGNAVVWTIFGLLTALAGGGVALLLSWAYIDYRPARDDAEAWVFLTVPAGWLTGALIAALAGWIVDGRHPQVGRSRRFFALLGPLVTLVLFITWFLYLNATVN